MSVRLTVGEIHNEYEASIRKEKEDYERRVQHKKRFSNIQQVILESFHSDSLFIDEIEERTTDRETGECMFTVSVVVPPGYDPQAKTKDSIT